MSRYIDADKAKEKLGVVRGAYSCFLEEDRPYYDVLSETIKMINEVPTADVRENVRGYWKKRKDKPLQNWYQCSNCGAICGETPKYCSECGADMRGEA